jgi:tetratricopeptide (TPR) repeat protein
MPIDPEIAEERGRIAYAWSLFAPGPEKRLRLTESLRWLHRAVAVADSRAEPRLRLAWASAQAGRIRQAEVQHQEAVRLDPTLARYRAYYGDFLLQQGRADEAADAYHGALCAFGEGKHETAADIFRRLYEATGSANLLSRACPDRPRTRAALTRFLKQHRIPVPADPTNP